MKKLQQGDRVRVKQNLKAKDNISCNLDMLKLSGTVITIKEVFSGEFNFYSAYENDWHWTDEMLEPLVPEQDMNSYHRHKSKFTERDLVRIKPLTGDTYVDGIYVTLEMAAKSGQEYVVEKVISSSVDMYKLLGDDIHTWTGGMLELLGNPIKGFSAPFTHKHEGTPYMGGLDPVEPEPKLRSIGSFQDMSAKIPSKFKKGDAVKVKPLTGGSDVDNIYVTEYMSTLSGRKFIIEDVKLDPQYNIHFYKLEGDGKHVFTEGMLELTTGIEDPKTTDAPMPTGAPKPPLGIIPQFIWMEQRVSDLASAIIRYAVAGYTIDQAWVEEYNAHILALVKMPHSKYYTVPKEEQK